MANLVTLGEAMLRLGPSSSHCRLTEIRPCPGSMARRFRSTVQSSFF